MWNRNEIFTAVFVHSFVSRYRGYIKVYYQSVVLFSQAKAAMVVWCWHIKSPSHCFLFCFTVAIPHKQHQNHCSDITTFFLYSNKGFLLYFVEIINQLKQPKGSVMDVGFKNFGIQYQLKDFNKKNLLFSFLFMKSYSLYIKWWQTVSSSLRCS